MRTLALLPLLGACGAEPSFDNDAAPTSMAVAQAAVPGTYGMTLFGEGVARPGNTLTFTATGAAPGEQIFFALGFEEQIGALCPPVLGGRCIDLRAPQLIRTVRADPSGAATLTVTVPSTVPPGGYAYFQALSASATSNTVVRFNPATSGTSTQTLGIYGQTAGPGASRGFYGYHLIGDATGFSRCQGGLGVEDDPAAVILPCPGCDFTFGSGAPITSGVEWSDNGSACVELWGFDITTGYAQPHGTAIGLDYDYGYAFLGYQYPGAGGTAWLTFLPATFGPAGRFEASGFSQGCCTY